LDLREKRGISILQRIKKTLFLTFIDDEDIKRNGSNGSKQLRGRKKNERTLMSIDITSKLNNFYMIVKQNKAFFSYYFLYQKIELDERNALV
jgi:hypothetical protein